VAEALEAIKDAYKNLIVTETKNKTEAELLKAKAEKQRDYYQAAIDAYLAALDEYKGLGE
jgi:hypothetical protein